MWGGLDFLLIDMPPGTGDIHLTIISEIKLDGAIIVSTPQQVAVADVVRGTEMFRHEQVGVPVLGIVENMAWFTPEELPNNRYYLFGNGGAARYAEVAGIDLLGQVPIIQSIMEGSESGSPAGGVDSRVEEYYQAIAEKVVNKLPSEC
jgi:ATP-binding protein involved in chromosome partitioning